MGTLPPIAFRVTVDTLYLRDSGVPEIVDAALASGRQVTRWALDERPAYVYAVGAAPDA